MNRARVVLVLRAGLGAVWVFHGLWSKLLGGIPRHREIVARVVGQDWADLVTLGVGAAEILLGAWVWSARAPRICALVQTRILLSMNLLEFWYARDLLLAPIPMLLANALLLGVAWWLAFQGRRRPLIARES